MARKRVSILFIGVGADMVLSQIAVVNFAFVPLKGAFFRLKVMQTTVFDLFFTDVFTGIKTLISNDF
jgi:hypothetical protein